jgi:hypothetical protein
MHVKIRRNNPKHAICIAFSEVFACVTVQPAQVVGGRRREQNPQTAKRVELECATSVSIDSRCVSLAPIWRTMLPEDVTNEKLRVDHERPALMCFAARQRRRFRY